MKTLEEERREKREEEKRKRNCKERASEERARERERVKERQEEERATMALASGAVSQAELLLRKQLRSKHEVEHTERERDPYLHTMLASFLYALLSSHCLDDRLATLQQHEETTETSF